MAENNNQQPLRQRLITAIWQLVIIVISATVIGTGFNYFRNKPLDLVSDWSDQGQLLDKTGKDISISLDDARRHFEAKTALFLDARDKESFNIGHIKAAENIPFQDVNKYFMDLVKKTTPETFIITYCDGQTCNLSHELALFLYDMGFTRVRVLVNGWTKWQEAGLPVETNKNKK